MPAGEALVDATDPLPPSLLGPRLIRRTYPIYGSRLSGRDGWRFSLRENTVTGINRATLSTHHSVGWHSKHRFRSALNAYNTMNH